MTRRSDTATHIDDGRESQIEPWSTPLEGDRRRAWNRLIMDQRRNRIWVSGARLFRPPTCPHDRRVPVGRGWLQGRRPKSNQQRRKLPL